MQIAVASNCLSIMAHQCFQNVLNKIWLNKLNPEMSSYIFGLATVCPLIAPLVLSFQKEKIVYVNSDEETSNENTNMEFDNEYKFNPNNFEF